MDGSRRVHRVIAVAILLAGSQSACTSHRTRKPSPVQTQRAPTPQRPRDPVSPGPARVEPTTPSPAPLQYTWYPRGRRIDQRWTHVVLHHSATASGSARTFDQFHRGKGWDELGYHFVIGNGTQTPDGMIEVGARWQKQKHGAHCKTPDNYFNDHGIGICLVGDFTGSSPTRKQLTSLYHLVRFLSETCSIPPDRVTTHCALSSRTVCPGRHFSVQPLRDALRASSRVSSAR